MEEEYTDTQEWEETEYQENPEEYEEHESYEGSEEEIIEDGAESFDTDLGERIDSLLEQIGHEKDYGTMGDYYIKEIGCYVYPNADVFGHFVDIELEGAGWYEASNGCYVPVEYLEDYESYLSGNSAENPENGEGIEGTGDVEEILEEPSVSLEDFNSLKEILSEMADQDAVFYESVTTYIEADTKAKEEISFQLSVISCTLIVICVFLALVAGNRFADIFFGRMRVG